jgi:hypothetical protein
MERKPLELPGHGAIPIGYLELIPVGPGLGEYKIVIQLQKGYCVLALRSDMCSGRISGILGRPPVAALPGAAPALHEPPDRSSPAL